MTISGFSYVRNGIEMGYPFLEAIQSILPVCDEFVVAVGESTDGTREAIAALGPKLKIIDTVWDMRFREGGKVFAQQTNIAHDHTTGDWAFHIQADEVIHEDDLPKIVKAISKCKDNERVEGFIFPFLHFWGDYHHVRKSRRVHAHEVRLFRNTKLIRSYADSQGFRKYKSIAGYEDGSDHGEKLHVKKIDAPIFHYNNVRSPQVQKKKIHAFDYLHNSESDFETPAYQDFNYQNVDRVVSFTNTHPAVMKARVQAQDWKFEYDPTKANWEKYDKYLQPVEDVLGFKIGEYKNYKLIR
jgi:glycosyltransferase involved in cell wall biosynthesis